MTTPVDWRAASPVTPGEFARELPGADVAITTLFTPEMGSAADQLRAIFVPAAGYENIDPDAVPPGCAVTNAYEHEAPITEWIFMVASAMDREFLKAERTFRAGSWEMWPVRHGSYRELHGRTMGVVGFGRIGQKVAQVADAFGMPCIAAGRKPDAPGAAAKLNATYHGGPGAISEVMRQADFVVVSTPLNDSTRGLIGENELAVMKPTAYLINPARGHVVDERALYDALKTHRIAGAAVDTWYQYPSGPDDDPRPAGLPFWELDNVIMTPHNSGATVGTSRLRAKLVAENIDRLSRGEPLLNVVDGLSRA